MSQSASKRPVKAKFNHQRMNSVSPAANLGLNLFFILYSALCVIPMLLLVGVSLSSEKSIINHGYQFLPQEISLEAYRFLLKDFSMVGNAYGVTLIVTLVGTLLNVIINAMYAYALSRRDFPWRNFFSIVILITLLFNAGIPPFYFVYVRLLHLKDCLLALILPGLSAGFYIFIMRTFFTQNIPAEIVESAQLDGAGEVKTFFKLVLPLSTPILATIALFAAIFYWNDFQNSMLFIERPQLSNLQYTMQKAIMNIEFLKRQIGLLSPAAQPNISMSAGRGIPSESMRMAMVVLSVGPIICAYPFLQKYFVKGLTVGAVKG